MYLDNALISQNKLRKTKNISRALSVYKRIYSDKTVSIGIVVQYCLDSNRIILDPPTEGSKHNIRYMVIVEPKNGDDLYLLETDSTGKSTDENVKYRVRVDNRR